MVAVNFAVKRWGWRVRERWKWDGRGGSGTFENWNNGACGAVAVERGAQTWEREQLLPKSRTWCPARQEGVDAGRNATGAPITKVAALQVDICHLCGYEELAGLRSWRRQCVDSASCWAKRINLLLAQWDISRMREFFKGMFVVEESRREMILRQISVAFQKCFLNAAHRRRNNGFRRMVLVVVLVVQSTSLNLYSNYSKE